MRFIAFVSCALFPWLPSAASAANLIADGGFETDAAPTGGYTHVAGGTSFDGGHWFVTGVDILQVDTAYAVGTAPPIRFNAHGGRSSLDLTGTGNSSPLDGIYQDIATVAGQAYTLRFFVGRATTSGSAGGDYRSDATVGVAIEGHPVTLFTNSDTVASGLAWQGFDLGFTATGPTSRIAFLNGIGNDYLGLDDVSVHAISPVPEPLTWSLTLAGFAAIGTGLRRRRRIPA